MKTVFTGKEIEGIVNVLPESEFRLEDEMLEMDVQRIQLMKKKMGFGIRRRAKQQTKTSDLMILGLKRILEQGWIKKENIGAILVTTATPDYFFPQISQMIQGYFELPQNIFTVDMIVSCSGYSQGIIEACMLLESMPHDKVVLLFTGDIYNRVAPNEQKYLTPPYGGDAATVTVIKNTVDNSRIFCLQGSGGDKENNPIMSPDYGFHNLFHSKQSFDIDHTQIFRYFSVKIPEVIREILQYSQLTIEQIDYFYFIQSNIIGTQRIMKILDIPKEKVPLNLLERFGDTSSNLNPIAIVDSLKDSLLEKRYKICICGYGAGLSWGTVIMDIGKMKFAEMIYSGL